MNELFDERPAPWSVDKHQFGAASVVAANGATVLTVNGVALAEFIADAANAFATDEDVFTAHDNNMQKIIVLTIQRDEARGEIAELLAIADAQSFQLTAAQARIAELEAFRDAVVRLMPALVASAYVLTANVAAPIEASAAWRPTGKFKTTNAAIRCAVRI